MKAPKCRICGVSEWGHVCGGGAVPVRVLQDRVTEIATKPPERKVTKKNKVTKTIKVTKPNKVTKRGRPQLGAAPLSSAEKMKRYRQRQTEARRLGKPVESGD